MTGAASAATGDRAGSSATYVFAVCRAVEPLALDGLPGMAPGRPVRALPVAGLTAVVQHVPADGFHEEAMRQRLGDVAELEWCARAHHEVVTRAAAGGPAVPMALATLYRDDERAATALAGEADRLRGVLRRVAGHEEWGVKVFLPAAPPAPPVPPRDSAGNAASRAERGRAYLAARRDAYLARDRSQEHGLRTADEVDAALGALAAASRRLRVHADGDATGDGGGRRGPQILNGAYLVARTRAGEFATLARTLGARNGALVDVTGPWVPYSFCGS